MSFGEEFKDLDPLLMEQAFANVSDDLIAMSQMGNELAARWRDYIVDLNQASEGYMAIIGRFEETIQMMSSTPGIEQSDESIIMFYMELGAYAVGKILAEYSKLESQDDF